jgi:hypothetical protein
VILNGKIRSIFKAVSVAGPSDIAFITSFGPLAFAQRADSVVSVRLGFVTMPSVSSIRSLLDVSSVICYNTVH